MVSLTNPETLEEFLEHGCRKLKELEAVTVLIKAKGALKPDLLGIRAAVYEVQGDIHRTRESIQRMREENEQCRELLALLQSLDRKILHMTEHIPDTLLSCCDKTNEDSPEISPDSKPKAQATPKAKEPKREQKSYPVLSPLNKEEFARVPRYIAGKQSLDLINGFLESLNRILKTKYSLLTQGKAHARKQGELTMFAYYEKQELDMRSRGECGQFFTAEDYERETNSKLSKAKLNQLVVLRHCKRIREYRVKNEIRYIVVPSE